MTEEERGIQIDADAHTLVERCEALGLDVKRPRPKGWGHMGAIIVDSALQRRRRYETFVRPRVDAILEAWPDAITTREFSTGADSSDLETVLRLKSGQRLNQIRDTCRVLEKHEVDTVADFASRLDDKSEKGDAFRDDLREISGVGPKTMEYFRILVGLDGVAIDVRLRRFARYAGIRDGSFDHLKKVFERAAGLAGTTPGALDAAIWEFDSRT